MFLERFTPKMDYLETQREVARANKRYEFKNYSRWQYQCRPGHRFGSAASAGRNHQRESFSVNCRWKRCRLGGGRGPPRCFHIICRLRRRRQVRQRPEKEFGKRQDRCPVHFRDKERIAIRQCHAHFGYHLLDDLLIRK